MYLAASLHLFHSIEDEQITEVVDAHEAARKGPLCSCDDLHRLFCVAKTDRLIFYVWEHWRNHHNVIL